MIETVVTWNFPILRMKTAVATPGAGRNFYIEGNMLVNSKGTEVVRYFGNIRGFASSKDHCEID
jgi:hypothetical protein